MNDKVDDMKLDDDNYPGEEEMEDMELEDTDFDLEGEYKEDPMAPQGTYNGITKNVEYEAKNNAIVWTIVATANPGLQMLDGQTPIDGTEYQFRNWLPKKGDENIRSKNGKSTKRQTKINMLKQFQDDMKIDMNTPPKVKDALENAEWIGLSVLFKVGFNTYQGRTRNQVDTMVRAEEEFDMPEMDESAF